MSISQSVTIISARDASASENCPWFYKNEPIWRISRTALLLLLTFSCFFWHCIAHIAHLHQFWIVRTRPKSCFGGVNERWAATLFPSQSWRVCRDRDWWIYNNPLSLDNVQLSISMLIPFLKETSILKTLLVILKRNYFTHYHHEDLVLDKLFCPKAVQWFLSSKQVPICPIVK